MLSTQHCLLLQQVRQLFQQLGLLRQFPARVLQTGFQFRDLLLLLQVLVQKILNRRVLLLELPAKGFCLLADASQLVPGTLQLGLCPGRLIPRGVRLRPGLFQGFLVLPDFREDILSAQFRHDRVPPFPRVFAATALVLIGSVSGRIIPVFVAVCQGADAGKPGPVTGPTPATRPEK